MKDTPRERVQRTEARPGAQDAKSIHDMFARVADRYDFLNHLLSLSIDRSWRRKTVDLLSSFEPRPDDSCLDLCTGTGDLLFEIARRLKLQVVGTDFCHPMLLKAVQKDRARGHLVPAILIEADSIKLPFDDDSFRFVTVAFGIRNVQGLEGGLREILRVLEPGGRALVLEFSTPTVPVFRELFNLYFSHVLPRLGSLVSGTKGPYHYLPASVHRFPSQREFLEILEASGFIDVHYRNLSLGIAALHWGGKPLRSDGALPDS